jgi:CBS domain containing-hemolysin-like protein
MVWAYILLVLFLLLLNAFFALAEFAVVKIRASRVDELVSQGDVRAQALKHIKEHLDEYLSVCQVGVTLSSIGLGFVGEPAVARLLQPLLARFGILGGAVSVSVSVGVTYVLMSYLSIVLAELVPKTIALRATEPMALLVSRLMRLCYTVFYVPLVILNRSADLVLRVLGFPRQDHKESLTEEELRIVLAASQGGGEISFRQLLHIENVLDAGGLRVRDAMRTRAEAKALRADAPWEENEKIILESRLSRFPLLSPGKDVPDRMVHIKDLYYTCRLGGGPPDLLKLSRPLVVAREESPLPELLSDLQRRRTHLAVVLDAKGAWTGLLTLEDVLEEFMGAVEDEFEKEPPVYLAEALSVGRIVLGVEAPSMQQALRMTISAVHSDELPLTAPRIVSAVLEREARFSTYLGRGLAIPHARLEGLDRPYLIFARSEQGIPMPGREEKVRLMFILLTPTQAAHTQVRLLGRIAGLLDSETVEKQLYEAKEPGSVHEAIRSGEQATLT